MFLPSKNAADILRLGDLCQLQPLGSGQPLPDLPATLTFQFLRCEPCVREEWNAFYRLYDDLLAASVVDFGVSGDAFPTALGSNWEWNQDTKRYRDMNTGRIITSNSRIGFRDDLIEKQLPEVRRLARGLRDGKVSVQGFVSSMRRIIKNSYLQQWALSRGGLNAMTSERSDNPFAAHPTPTRILYKGLLNRLREGELSYPQIRNRSEMYVHSSTQSAERAKASSFDIDLPEYPGDGNQICRARCKCRWEIKEEEELTLCYWLLNYAVRALRIMQN